MQTYCIQLCIKSLHLLEVQLQFNYNLWKLLWPIQICYADLVYKLVITEIFKTPNYYQHDQYGAAF